MSTTVKRSNGKVKRRPKKKILEDKKEIKEIKEVKEKKEEEEGREEIKNENKENENEEVKNENKEEKEMNEIKENKDNKDTVNKPEFLFKIFTKEGYTFKVISDLLKQKVKKCNFILHPKGMFIKTSNSNGYAIKARAGYKRFVKYFCPKQLSIGLNMSHFQKMLKPVKKRDSLSSHISSSQPELFRVIPDRVDITSTPDNSIRIISVVSEDLNIPDSKYDPELEITCLSKNFQSVIKNITGISGKKLEISGYKKQLRFYCDNNGMLTTDIPLEDIENTNKYFPTDKNELDFFGTFAPIDITCLNKCVGLSNSVKIKRGKDLPLKIDFLVSGLFDITIYIKSKELIASEQMEKESNSELVIANIELIDDDVIDEKKKSDIDESDISDNEDIVL